MLLDRDSMYATEDSYRLLIVKNISDAAMEATNDQHSQPPCPAFSSPFIGVTIPELCRTFYDKFYDSLDFSDGVFFILDERSVRDETLLVVESYDSDDTDDWPNKGVHSLRTDFWVARVIATLSDIGQEGLLEQREILITYILLKMSQFSFRGFISLPTRLRFSALSFIFVRHAVSDILENIQRGAGTSERPEPPETILRI